MEALDNKCPACSAKIDFNPKSQMWECEYCGSKFTLEEMQKHKNASSEEANTVTNNDSKKELTNYHCKNCGAEIVADDTVTATFCVYCGSTAILKEKIDEGIAPEEIIPFKNTKEEARDAFTKLTKGKPLMPRKFKEVRNIEKISGVYIPFWAYDIECDGEISFNCTDITTWSDSKYMYTKTDKYLSTVDGHYEYNKVLADASSRFKDELMDSIEPFNYSELVKYNHAYLSGFLAEKYDVSQEDAFKRAESRSVNSSIDLARTKVIHQSVVNGKNSLNVKNKKTNYIMLPVWMVNINYNNKIYTFAMNGQTGRMVGDIPIGKKETVLWAIGIFIVLFTIGCLIVGL